jgi:uncharacterized membrane protein YjdF
MKKESVLSVLIYIVIFVFMILYIIQENYEFIGYNIMALLFFWLVLYFYNRTKMPFIVLFGFCIWLFLHMLGGLDINGMRVYGVMIFNLIGDPLYILRYDQVIHVYCYIVVGAILYYVIEKKAKKMDWVFLFFIILASMGIGAFNEIFEFGMVLSLGSTGVGDYYNTSIDIVANTIGAVIGVLLSHRYSKRR